MDYNALVRDQINALHRYREQSIGTQASYLDGAIAALEWSLAPQDYISLAATCALGIDPSRPVQSKPKLSLVQNEDPINEMYNGRG